MKNPLNKKYKYKMRLTKTGKKSLAIIVYADNDLEAQKYAEARLPAYGYEKAAIAIKWNA